MKCPGCTKELSFKNDFGKFCKNCGHGPLSVRPEPMTIPPTSTAPNHTMVEEKDFEVAPIPPSIPVAGVEQPKTIAGLQVGGAAAKLLPQFSASPQTVVLEQPICGWLVVLYSPALKAYHDIPIYKGNTTLNTPRIGADARSDAQIQATDDGRFLITDPKQEGVFVRGQKVHGSYALCQGDQIVVGGTQMVFIPVAKAAA